MSSVHVVVDFQFIYYKYMFSLLSGKLKVLTRDGEPAYENGEITASAKDVSMRYYCIKEIENFRRSLQDKYDDIVVTVCFDSKSVRSEDADYKKDRKSSLGASDFDTISGIKDMLTVAGYNCFKIEGYEADDIVTSAVHKYKDEFDKTVVYSIDKDILVNVSEDMKVIVRRYRQKRGYVEYDANNITELTSEEFKTIIPYGMLPLYLCTVGDKSDAVKGIKGFGNAAFAKIVSQVLLMVKDTSPFNNYDYTEELIKRLGDKLGNNGVEQALDSLSLIRSLNVRELPDTLERSSMTKRIDAYSDYKFTSLYE